MANASRVRRAEPEDWSTVRRLRLAALLDAPAAFGSTHAREIAFSDDEWQRRVTDGIWFLAESAAVPVGIAAAFFEDATEEPHLVALWVAPTSRGSGIAEDLVVAVCDWAVGQGSSELALWVADGNPAASRLYERLGFVPTGDRKPLPHASAIGETMMRKRLANSTA